MDQAAGMDYSKFLESKRQGGADSGFKPLWMPDCLFDFQRIQVEWALRKGRAALFDDCGLGKTLMELSWAANVTRHTGGQLLHLAPLAVGAQTVREGEKFGIECSYARSMAEIKTAITVTNYEMLHAFDVSKFAGVTLDESSIIKAFDGSTRTEIINAFEKTDYKLACTATPSPNDYMELGNHAEFLGIMSRAEMLAMYFVHDGGDTSKWRLKGHAVKEFWKWVSSWALCIRKPSDLGCSDEGYELPPIEVKQITVDAETPTEGMLFAMPAHTLEERRGARKGTVDARVAACSKIVNATNEQFLVWCGLNDESQKLSKEIIGAVEVTGSDAADHKEKSLLGFADGVVRKLVSKVSIAGFGMNFQSCHLMAFVGLSDSFEQYYQAVRRCHRFGQKHPVTVYVITASTEGAVVANIIRKEKDAENMANEMVEHMRDLNLENVKGSQTIKSEYAPEVREGENWKLHLSDCVDMTRSLPDNSIGYTIFSPPFSSLYTYSNSDRDMGNCKDDAVFMEHYRFLVRELYRVTQPGRLMSFHCMNLPTSKQNHGYIGIRDFRGELIRMANELGFIFHSEVCIWKDPVTAMQRTKALGLLWKQLKKDSAMSRQSIPDYLVTMRKPGENEKPIAHTPEEFPVDLWQRYASPVWMDINPSDTLTYREAREENDERHICPLQLQVIERGIDLWSAPGDTVLSPFAGIGSEGYVALKMGRKFVGSELKRSYFDQACKNLHAAKSIQGGLFDAG